jgi:NADPH:quinone reductase-like Zn-dependent oxidoreductase
MPNPEARGRDQAVAEQMHALRLHERRGRLLYEQAEIPEPGIGDVLVSVQAASLTPTELEWPSTWVDRRGLDRTPIVPCHEVCGQVVELGYGTSGLAVGDEVFGLTDWYRDGAAAEYVVVEARNLAPKPKGCGPAEAAATALAGLTAWQALFEHLHLGAGESVLITGATGGVGSFAVPLARAAGATVIAAGRSRRSAAAERMGAEVYVDADEPGWTDQLDHVDAVFDLVGGELLDQIVAAALATRIVSVVAPRDGVDFFVVEPDRAALGELAGRIDDGSLRPLVAEAIPLAQGAAAFTNKLDQPGKRVLTVP